MSGITSETKTSLRSEVCLQGSVLWLRKRRDFLKEGGSDRAWIKSVKFRIMYLRKEVPSRLMNKF
jgi:hypothetical protein